MKFVVMLARAWPARLICLHSFNPGNARAPHKAYSKDNIFSTQTMRVPTAPICPAFDNAPLHF